MQLVPVAQGVRCTAADKVTASAYRVGSLVIVATSLSAVSLTSNWQNIVTGLPKPNGAWDSQSYDERAGFLKYYVTGNGELQIRLANGTTTPVTCWPENTFVYVAAD